MGPRKEVDSIAHRARPRCDAVVCRTSTQRENIFQLRPTTLAPGPAVESTSVDVITTAKHFTFSRNARREKTTVYLPQHSTSRIHATLAERKTRRRVTGGSITTPFVCRACQTFGAIISYMWGVKCDGKESPKHPCQTNVFSSKFTTERDS